MPGPPTCGQVFFREVLGGASRKLGIDSFPAGLFPNALRAIDAQAGSSAAASSARLAGGLSTMASTIGAAAATAQRIKRHL
jgi:hypothetical protein